ncbi:hypothetical protein M8C21_002654 [Ambrosia artemisiifolia]|uniref:Uncharacterized protein n=1 Tax=Ambrosia artemisiifolia TaxID=4212 RepID=A0AAD5GLW8_AMBAR|nr:hypothetical protein M8C21_002654 [Ambrosia artemisiifolia]
MLDSKGGFDEIEFNTPNLVLFAYPCISQSFDPMIRHSTHLKACMRCYPTNHIDAIWFQKLRLFLTKKNGFKVLNLYISAIGQKFTDIEKLKAIELPPYELEHVELLLDFLEESSAYIPFVDAVLWCCRPRSLTLRSSVPFEEQGDVVKFTYKKLLEQEDHTSIQIVGPSSSEAQKQLRDLKSLSVGLCRDGNSISFIKEEVVQEEALNQRFADMEIF